MEHSNGIEKMKVGSWEVIESIETLPKDRRQEVANLIRDFNLYIPKARAQNAPTTAKKISSHAEVPVYRMIARIRHTLNLDAVGQILVLWDSGNTHIIGIADIATTQNEYAVTGVYVRPEARGNIKTIPSLLKTVVAHIRSTHASTTQRNRVVILFSRMRKEPLGAMLVRELGAHTVSDDLLIYYIIPFKNLERYTEKVSL